MQFSASFLFDSFNHGSKYCWNWYKNNKNHKFHNRVLFCWLFIDPFEILLWTNVWWIPQSLNNWLIIYNIERKQKLVELWARAHAIEFNGFHWILLYQEVGNHLLAHHCFWLFENSSVKITLNWTGVVPNVWANFHQHPDLGAFWPI